MLRLARSRPESLNCGTAGPGTNPHIAGELFNYLGKVNMVAIHSKGGGPALIAAIGGEVSVSLSGAAETSRYAKAARAASRAAGEDRLHETCTTAQPFAACRT